MSKYKNFIKQIIIISIALCFGFSYGIVSYKFQLPPFKTLYKFWVTYVVHEEKKVLKETYNKLDFNGDLNTIDQTIKKVKNNPKKILDELVKTTILPENLFKINKRKLRKIILKISVAMEILILKSYQILSNKYKQYYKYQKQIKNSVFLSISKDTKVILFI